MRRSTYAFVVLVLVAMLFSACTAVVPTAPAGAPAAAAPPEHKITMIIYTPASVEFFAPAVQGAKEAAQKFNIDLDIQYADSDNVKQNNLIETAIANKVDGIAVIIQDDNAFDENVCKAMEQGIGVVSFNVDDSQGADGNCRMAFMGQNFVDTGYLIGKRMIEEHGLKAGDLVFAPVEAPEAVYATLRYEGLKKALDEAGIASELVETKFDLAGAQTVVVQWLLGHPDVDAIVGLGSVPLTVAPKAMEEAGIKVPVGGFDLTPEIIKGIEDGVITATVDQQPYSQGFYAIAQLALWLQYGLFPSDMDTGGIGLVDASNVQTVKELVGKYR